MKNAESDIERLKRDLAIARETNQRLNRRCQELDHEIASVTRELKSVIVSLGHETHRTWSYANRLRDLYNSKKRGLNAWYEGYWKQLPRPDNEYIDGIPQRVKEALRLIEEGKKQRSKDSPPA